MAKEASNDVVLLTDLDTILDTRAAVIKQSFSMLQFLEILKNGYFDRFSDEFITLGEGEFQKAYQARTKIVLKDALATPALFLSAHFSKTVLEARVNSPLRKQPHIHLNTYPYELTEQETRLVIAGFAAAIKNIADITAVYIPPEDVTPKLLKTDYVEVMMYDYIPWLDLHSENKNFVETQCPGVRLYGPALLRQEKMKQIAMTTSSFKALEEYASLFIGLSVVPASYFSIDMNRMKKSQ